MLYSCPNHELSREMIIQNFYARLSDNNRTILYSCCAGSFMMKTIEFKWDLLERIKRNSEDWDLDKGKESGDTSILNHALISIFIAKFTKNIGIHKRLNTIKLRCHT